jgi:hypothetical protein
VPSSFEIGARSLPRPSRLYPRPSKPPPAPLLPIYAVRRHAASVFHRVVRGSSPFMDELLATIHTIVASALSLLRVALFAAAFRRDFWIHHLATFRAERHWRVLTLVIQVRTVTLRHKPSSSLRQAGRTLSTRSLALTRNSSTHRFLPSPSRESERPVVHPNQHDSGERGRGSGGNGHGIGHGGLGIGGLGRRRGLRSGCQTKQDCAPSSAAVEHDRSRSV